MVSWHDKCVPKYYGAKSCGRFNRLRGDDRWHTESHPARFRTFHLFSIGKVSQDMQVPFYTSIHGGGYGLLILDEILRATRRLMQF